MIGTGLAILGAGLLGAGASMYSANKAADTQANAANQAAQIQAQGQQRALDFQQGVFNKQSANFDASKAGVDAANGYLKDNVNSSSNLLKANYDNTAGNLNPFIQSGIGANNQLASFYGLNGGNGLPDGALTQFLKSPDYQFALKGGSDALDNSAASRGGLIGGNQMRAQAEYGQGLATQTLGNYLTRLGGISQQGQGAAGTLGSLGAQTGSAIGSLGNSAGTAMLGGATNMASVGANLGSGMANTNAYTNLNGSNSVAQSVMGAGTAQASGILGMDKGFNSGLNALTMYNQLGKSSYGGSPTNLLSSYSGTGSAYNGNQLGQLY